MAAYDAVVIGAGHNGLATAVRLAEKGWSVAVVEAKATAGGAVKTQELTLPGFRHDVCAMNLSMFAGSGFFAAHKQALWIRASGSCPRKTASRASFVTEPISASAPASTRRRPASRLSRPRMHKPGAIWLSASIFDAPHIFALLGSPMPSFAAAKVVWKAWRQRGTGWLFETLRLLLASPRDFLDGRFTHPKVKTMMAAWGLHLDFPPDVAGGALFPISNAWSTSPLA